MGKVYGLAEWRFGRRGALMVLLLVLGGFIAGPGMAGGQSPEYRPPQVPTNPGPRQSDHLGAALFQQSHPHAVPAGTNDFACQPTAAHPRPVLLAHGTDASAYTDWSALAPALTDAGYCVFAPNYGGKPGATSFGTEDIRLSAQQIGVFVSEVLAATGAEQVDIVGFSQGATVTRYYINKLGGASSVRQWIGLAAPSYGGVMYGLVPLGQKIPGAMLAFAQVTSLAAVQQAQGSPLMRELNAGGDTVPGVRYVTIGSRVDEMIQPFENIALRGPGAENIVLQDRCPQDLTGHFYMVYDPYIRELVREILDPATAEPPHCRPVALGTGIPQVIIGGNI